MEALLINVGLIKNDIEKMKQVLDKESVKIGLFGSCLRMNLNDANDIDIVIYCRKEIDQIKSLLLQLKLNYPICPHKMNGTYGIKENATKKKHYHIILLNEKNPNIEFERINKGQIKFI